jgi:hypothetical protein
MKINENLLPSYMFTEAKVLWKNPDPAAKFTIQTVTLNTDDWDVFEIYAGYNGDTQLECVCRGVKGYHTNMLMNIFSGEGRGCHMRQAEYVDDTHIKFGTNWYFAESSKGSADQLNVPVVIIGYKTGLYESVFKNLYK